MQIVGHTRQRDLLLSEVENDNVAHAYLFAGQRHLGKYTVAKWFAGMLLTQEADDDQRKDILKRIKKNIHPDLLTLDRLWIDGECTDWSTIAQSSNALQQHRAKARVKTDVIGIDDIRALQERLHETPQGNVLCCLIRSIERLHPTAANALLKILEEPPQHVVFCFTTQALGALPETVISRMRTVHFSPLAKEELRSLLDTVPEEDRPFLLELAQGCPGIIFECLNDTEQLRTLRQTSLNAQRFLNTSSLVERFEQAKELCLEPDSPLLPHLFLQLRKELHSSDTHTSEHALKKLKGLFALLSTLKSNTNKSLLSAQITLHCS